MARDMPLRLLERWRHRLREARYTRFALLLAAGINLIAWILTLWFVLPRLSTNPFFALHYNIYFGVDRIGAPWKLLGLPLLGLLILLADAAFWLRHGAKDPLAGAFMLTLAVLLESLILFATFLTLLLNL